VNRSNTIAGMLSFLKRDDAEQPPLVAQCSRYPHCFCGRGAIVCAIRGQRLTWPRKHFTPRRT
jgi:hypothetical protein